MNKPFMYWCWKNPYLHSNQLRPYDCETIRNMAIKNCEDAYGKPWRKLKAEGFSVVRVIVKEVKK